MALPLTQAALNGRRGSLVSGDGAIDVDFCDHGEDRKGTINLAPSLSLAVHAITADGVLMLPTIQLSPVFLLVAIAAVAFLAARLQIPLAILLVITGVGLALVPGLPRIELAPEFLLLLVLPPIIYSSAVAMSWREFRFNLLLNLASRHRMRDVHDARGCSGDPLVVGLRLASGLYFGRHCFAAGPRGASRQPLAKRGLMREVFYTALVDIVDDNTCRLPISVGRRRRRTRRRNANHRLYRPERSRRAIHSRASPLSKSLSRKAVARYLGSGLPDCCAQVRRAVLWSGDRAALRSLSRGRGGDRRKRGSGRYRCQGYDAAPARPVHRGRQIAVRPTPLVPLLWSAAPTIRAGGDAELIEIFAARLLRMCRSTGRSTSEEPLGRYHQWFGN